MSLHSGSVELEEDGGEDYPLCDRQAEIQHLVSSPPLNSPPLTLHYGSTPQSLPEHSSTLLPSAVLDSAVLPSCSIVLTSAISSSPAMLSVSSQSAVTSLLTPLPSSALSPAALPSSVLQPTTVLPTVLPPLPAVLPSSLSSPASPPPAYATSTLSNCRHSDSYTSLTASSMATEACRICHCEAESGMPLISPCSCSGTLKYVHQACLQQWIKSANTKSCELCKLDFQMTTSVKPFRKWQKLDMTKVERRKIVCSVTFHVIAITCVVWSLYVLIDRTTEEIKGNKLEWPFWTKLIVVAIGFTGGLVFMYVQCKMYIQLCRRWRAYNRVIYVQDCPLTAVHRGARYNVRKNTSNTNSSGQKCENVASVGLTRADSCELNVV